MFDRIPEVSMKWLKLALVLRLGKMRSLIKTETELRLLDEHESR